MNRRGALLRVCAAGVLDARTMEEVIDPAIADLQHEPFSLSGYLAVVIVVVIGGVSMLRGTMRCSFCRRADSEVAKLVAGPWRIVAGRVYICDRCAMQTIQIMEGHSSDESPRGATESLFRRTLSRWGWLRSPDGRSECHVAALASGAES